MKHLNTLLVTTLMTTAGISCSTPAPLSPNTRNALYKILSEPPRPAKYIKSDLTLAEFERRIY